MKKNVRNKMKKLSRYIRKRTNDRAESAEKEVDPLEFLLYSAYINAYSPITDLSFIVDELKALIKRWKQRKISQKQRNKRSYEAV